MTSTPFQALLDLLVRLDQARIHYSLFRAREEAVMVCISVPGERWEVEFLSTGSVEIEVFRSDGAIHDGALLALLFARFSDGGAEPPAAPA